MGGYGSGRSGGRPIIENSLTLDLAKLLRDRIIQPNSIVHGTLVWTNSRTHQQVGSMGYQAELKDEYGRLRLHYTTTSWNREKYDSDYWIELTTMAQPFGGRRWWFVCPCTGQRAGKLYLPTEAPMFASRKAYRLGYRSQRETPRDRALSRAFTLRHRLGAGGGIGDHVPRPKGMHLSTYNQCIDRILQAERIVDSYSESLLAKLKLTKST